MRFCSMQTSMLNTSSLYKRHSSLDTCYYDLRYLHLGGWLSDGVSSGSLEETPRGLGRSSVFFLRQDS